MKQSQMDLDNLNGKMAENIKDNGKIIRSMDLEFMFGHIAKRLMIPFILVISKLN